MNYFMGSGEESAIAGGGERSTEQREQPFANVLCRGEDCNDVHISHATIKLDGGRCHCRREETGRREQKEQELQILILSRGEDQLQYMGVWR